MIDPATLDQFFAFKIGDFVRPKSHPMHVPLLVVSRFLEQCHGGVQLHYHTRSMDIRNHCLMQAFLDWTEIELTACETPLEFDARLYAAQKEGWKAS